eukprot:gene16959-8457_t
MAASDNSMSSENGIDDQNKTPPKENEAPKIQQESKQRLVITHIVNEFFKSYAGKQVLGPFHKSFSSIVGPNGSGKSNVIDAMLFVFGYRSKRIRSKKLSLLIHNSDQHSNVQSCTVSVHFQMIVDLPGDEFEIVPNSQFVVSRTARKDGSSDYYVDGKKKTFKEVGTLLRQSGIDLDHNRFLILQGEVEQIAMMKPKAETEHDEGMLEYLEDIIGTSRFKEPIEQLAKEVEDLSEKRKEKLERVKVVEKEKDELEGAKEEAVQFLSSENEITKLHNCLYQKYLYECKLNIEKAGKKKDEVKKQLDDIQATFKEISDQVKEKGKGRKKISREYEKLTNIAEKCQQAFTEFENKDAALRNDKVHRDREAKKLRKALEKEKEKLSDLTTEPERNNAEIERLKKAQVELEAEKSKKEEKLNEIMAGLKDETEGMQAEKEEKENELMEKKKVVNETKSKLDLAKGELELYLSQHKSLKEQLKAAEENMKNAANTIDNRKSEITALTKEVPELEKKCKTTEKELVKVTKEEEGLATKVKSSKAKLEEVRSSLNASKSRNSVLSALMGAKKSGELPGIYGRLGDLGAIDEKYDVAVSTACSPLDHVVVEDIDCATKCIEFLKKNNVGVSTFISLDKMEVWREKAKTKITTPENVPRLFDLIKVNDAKVKNAFYFALRNTLVANTLEQATRIAYGKDGKRNRVVTVKGELIEASGTMSGGGKSVSRGRMGGKIVQDVDARDVEKIEKNVEADVEKLEALSERKVELERELEAIKKELAAKMHSLQKANMEIQALTEQLKEQKERVVTLEEQLKKAVPDRNHIDSLEAVVSSCTKDFNKASKAAGTIEEAVQKLHKKIMDIGGSKLRSQQMQVDSVKKLMDEVSQEISKANVAIKTAKRNLTKAEEKCKSLEKEIQENDEMLEKIDKEFVTLEDEAAKVIEEREESQAQAEVAKEELQKINAECTELEKNESELKAKEVDVKHELQQYENILKENSMKLRHHKDKINKLSLHNVGTEASEPEKLPTFEDEELKDIDQENLQYKISVEEEKLKAMQPNMAAIAEYRKKEEAYLERVAQCDEVTSERDTKRKEHESLRKQRLEEFMAGFSTITTKLKEMYQMITLGGDAELELLDSLDPFSEGIVFSVRPPKKCWKNISHLSGGEKTLSSLALVFALHHYKPTPLYVMDEIDAALDFKNVSIVANYIKERTKNAQFIIISLRNNMFELADRLVGIYKTNNCTKSVVINPDLLVAS